MVLLVKITSLALHRVTVGNKLYILDVMGCPCIHITSLEPNYRYPSIIYEKRGDPIRKIVACK